VSTLPHRLREPAEEGATGVACEPGDLDELEACVMTNCDGVPADMLVGCALESCFEEVDQLPTPCLTCVSSNIGGGDLDAIRATCESEGSGSFAYGGSFGTGLLSSRPFLATDTLVLPSTINRRAVLYAEIDTEGWGSVHLFGTHLSANLSSVPYRGEFESWADEQREQIARTLAFIDDKAGDGGRVVLAGDLNNGPAIQGGDAELLSNYEEVVAAGFENPYAERADAACTFCDENPLNGGVMGGEGDLIDHVMVRNMPGQPTTERFLTSEIQLQVDDMAVTTAYSDHYGVRLELNR
jgi:endonuclease/exonuclease/phosphatase family metal-dependent hydrolase